VNKGCRELAEGRDIETLRTAIAALLALIIWLLVLAALSAGLLESDRPAPAPVPLEMRVVVLDEPASPESRTPQTPIASSERQAEPHARTPSRPSAQRATPPQPRTPTMPAAPAQPEPIGSPAQQPSQDEPAQRPAAAANSTTAARSISQPLPSLPDDLREQAYRTVATARFTIHADGTVDVELIEATPNPRLNQLLLDTLRRWRFFPALRDGQPVESTQDIRVHFNVT
jgi:periplasmic protein TonB